MTRSLASVSLLAVLIFSGCAYSVGPTNGNRAGAQTIEIRPFANATQEPRIIDPLVTALRRTIQRDGTFTLSTRDGADIVVSGTIVRYSRIELSVQPTDVVTVRDYRLELVAKVTARVRSTGRMLLDRDVSGHTTIRVGSDLVTSERQAIPLAAENLAFNITSLLADGDF
jgi:hypothetical protein